MRTCTISIHADTGDLTIRSPYDAGFVADIKTEIPSFARRWSPKPDNFWVVQEIYGADAVLVCERYYHQVSYIGDLQQIERLEAQAKLQRIVVAHHAAQTAQATQAARDQEAYTPKPLAPLPPERVTYFSILGVDVNADENAIRQGYKNAARSAHPDGGGSHEQFLAVQKAYETLRDPKQRKKYLFGLKLVGELKELPPVKEPDADLAQAVANTESFENLMHNLLGKQRRRR